MPSPGSLTRGSFKTIPASEELQIRSDLRPTPWLGDLVSNHDYRSQSRFPGPPWGALTRLPTSPGETLGLQDMEDSFQVTCPYLRIPINSPAYSDPISPAIPISNRSPFRFQIARG